MKMITAKKNWDKKLGNLKKTIIMFVMLLRKSLPSILA